MRPLPIVMAGLDPAIHVFSRCEIVKWMRGSSPRMTPGIISPSSLRAKRPVMTC
jgi:hypothetical protein